jgi:hypothetical protein
MRENPPAAKRESVPVYKSPASAGIFKMRWFCPGKDSGHTNSNFRVIVHGPDKRREPSFQNLNI